MKITVYSPTHWRIADALFEPANHELQRIEGGLDEVIVQLGNIPTDILFLHGFSMDTNLIAEISRICRQFPQMAVVPHCEEPEREFLIKLMRAGVKEVLLSDSPESVRDVLARINHDMKKSSRESGRSAKVIGLISAKGGDGSSMMTANLGWALSMSPNVRVLTIDLALPFGDLDLFLTAEPPIHTLVNFSDEIQRIDASLLGTMVHHATSQLDLVPSPKSFDDAFRINTSHMQKIISVAAKEYDYVLLDFGSQVSPFVINVLDQVDEIVMVTTATMPSVRQASQLMRLWEELDFDVSRVTLLLNQFHEQALIKPEEVARAVGRSLEAIIPKDDVLTQESLVQSDPVVHYAPKSKLAKAIVQWAARWTGEVFTEDKSIWHRLKIR